MSKIGPVVFFGSGPVAADSLKRLHTYCEIEAVFTKPRAPHHRGSVPVIECADELKLPIITVSNKHELDSVLAQNTFKSRAGVLIDFGIIVSDQAIHSFPLGILNSHFSVLPELRGADPITFAILSGQETTGVSLMQLVPALDEGPLLAFEELPLNSDIDAPRLTVQLIKLSDTLLRKHLNKYLQGSITLQPQTVTGKTPSYTRKLSKLDARLDWQKSARELAREVRAFLGWPGSKTTLGTIDVTIEKAHPSQGSGKPGTILHDATTLSVQTSDGTLVIEQLKPAGKSSMSTQSFLAGYGKRLP